MMGPSPGAARLPADEVHVWYVFSDRATDADLLRRYDRLMNEDERARHQRFVFAGDRHRFLVTRGFVRTLLAAYTGVEPASCLFTCNQYGRPALVSSESASRIEFNLSHTTDLITCAVARDREVGIDVEDVDRMAIEPGLPRRFFSPAEADALDALAPSDRKSRFFDYWTLKEAYIKARGMGLSLPLDGFTLHLDDHGPPRITFARTIADEPASWQFAQFDPDPRHRMALAIRRRGADLTVRIREFDPRRPTAD